jgi:hypothetical protein
VVIIVLCLTWMVLVNTQNDYIVNENAGNNAGIVNGNGRSKLPSLRI